MSILPLAVGVIMGAGVPVGPPIFNLALIISVSQGPYDIRAASISAGWNGTDILLVSVTVNSGVTVLGTGGQDDGNNGVRAMTFIGALPATSTITLFNNGTIRGGGGAGGLGSEDEIGFVGDGGDGAHAISVSQAGWTINNNASGTINGGSGGGGGGATDAFGAFGGGGGGGWPNAVGGMGGSTATNGDDATVNGGGAGGIGIDGLGTGGNGGNGGGGNAAGTVGSLDGNTGQSAGPNAGGTRGFAGKAINFGGQSVVFNNSGTVTGAVS